MNVKSLLRQPTYYQLDGSSPSTSSLWREFFSRFDLRNKHNWMPFASWMSSLLLIIPCFIFFKSYFSWKALAVGVGYGVLVLSVHNTAYLHRFCSHRAFKIKNKIFLTIFRNLSIKIILEEIFAISHIVHHKFPDQAGDPYNAKSGWLFCFIADVNHQPINTELTKDQYKSLVNIFKHTGVRINNYSQYLKWGSLTHPMNALINYLLNWTFWFSVFYFSIGAQYTFAIFGCCFLWAVSIRNFNYKSHAKGIKKHKRGLDFYHEDLSVNLPLAGITAGEWHNNHHLYPNSARSGFLWWQPDLAFNLIKFFELFGFISDVKDSKEKFIQEYYIPYKDSSHTGLINEVKHV